MAQAWGDTNRQTAKARRGGKRKAVAFYRQTLGYTHKTTTIPGGNEYHMLMADGQMCFGIFKLDGVEVQDVPDHFVSDIAVDKVDARASGVEEAGSEVLQPAFDVPGVGRIVMLKDAVGAVHGWMTPSD